MANCDSLALKYSTAGLNEMVGILPNEEIIEIIRTRSSQEFEDEVKAKYQDRILNLEDELYDAESREEEHRCAAQEMYSTVLDYINNPSEEAIEILKELLSEHEQYS